MIYRRNTLCVKRRSATRYRDIVSLYEEQSAGITA